MSSRQMIEKIGFILFGTIILSFGFYNFYFLNHITEGGVLGFLLLLKNLFGIHPSMASIIIDFSLLLIGYKIFGKEFFLYSLFASFAFSVTYGIFENIGPILPSINNSLINAILGGIFVGVGCGIIFNTGCSSGGDDALALVIAKTTSLSVTKVYILMDGVILLLSLSYLSADAIFYSMIASTLSGKIIDLFLAHTKGTLRLITA